MRVAITTVPERRAVLIRLRSQLQRALPDTPVDVWVDHRHRGVWWNVTRALRHAVGHEQHTLVLQDDALLFEVFERHIHVVAKHVDNVGLVSLFTPPRKRNIELWERGYNSLAGHDFMWAPAYIVNHRFARLVLALDRYLDKQQVGQHDEVRYRVAAQFHDIPLVTLLGSLVQHDIGVRSTFGTAGKVGGTVRQTTVVATEESCFKHLRPAIHRTQADLKYLLPEANDVSPEPWGWAF